MFMLFGPNPSLIRRPVHQQSCTSTTISLQPSRDRNCRLTQQGLSEPVVIGTLEDGANQCFFHLPKAANQLQ